MGAGRKRMEIRRAQTLKMQAVMINILADEDFLEYLVKERMKLGIYH